MSVADSESQTKVATVESPVGDAAEKPVVEAVESLRAGVEEKLGIEEAEEVRLSPDASHPKSKEATPATEAAEPAAPGSPRSNVAEKPLVEQPEAERRSAEGVTPPAEEAKPAAKAAEPAAAEERRHRVVLICFDDSEHSRRAVQFYVRGLSRPDDHVVLMHAIEAQEILLPPHTMYMTSYASPTFQEDLKRMKSKMTGKGVEFQALLKAVGVKSRIHVMDGPEKPGVYLVQKAAKLDANLIVIGSRGLGVVRRTFMGSVSDYVLHHAGCATCVVPPQHRR